MYLSYSYITITIFVITGVFLHYQNNIPTLRKLFFLSLLSIISFALTYGLRNGWLVDWNVYKDAFNTPKTNPTIANKPVLLWINNSIKYFNGNYNTALCVYCSIFIFGFLSILKDYYKIIWLALPVFYILSFELCAQHISFSLAIGFIFLFYYFYYHKNNKIAIFFAVLGIGCHPFSILFVIIFIFYKKINILALDAKYLIIIYGISFLFSSSTISNYLIHFTSGLNFFLDKSDFNQYSSGAFEDNYLLASNEMFSIFSKIRIFLLYSIIIFFASKFDSKYKNFPFLFSMSYIGMILANLAYGVQILDRYGYVFNLFQSFTIPIVFQYLYRKKKYIEITICIILLFDHLIRNNLLLHSTTLFDKYI